jgi:hypothetical protein
MSTPSSRECRASEDPHILLRIGSPIPPATEDKTLVPLSSQFDTCPPISSFVLFAGGLAMLDIWNVVERFYRLSGYRVTFS